jgi:winged helix DNA-binding protein
MDIAKLRAWRSHRQGLDGSLAGQSAAAVLARSGWARSVGGVGPYLTLFSRGGINRAAADAAVANLDIHELPAARGCTYVVPSADFALALKAGEPFGDGEMKVARKLGVTDVEIDKLCNAIVKALGKGPLDPEQIRDSVGPAARSLGEEGKKKGLTTTLPVALGRLQEQGEIRRVPVNGRLDQQRYRYALWRPNPLAGFKQDAAEVQSELARRYFQWIGPASIAEFQWFSGLGVKAAQTAVGPLGLEPLEAGSDLLMLAEDREQLATFRVPKSPQYSLVSSLDAISLLRRDLKGLLDPEDLKRQFPVEKGSRTGSELADLPSHAILDRGRVIGLWEFDTTTESIVSLCFVKKDKALIQAIAKTEEYVKTELGDARSFSLDSPKSRTPKIEAMRAAGA